VSVHPKEKKFWKKVEIKALNECWEWKGSGGGGEYGYFYTGFKTDGAHRVSLEIKLGRSLKKGEWALHRCDNPSCVNPHHLFLGDAKLNVHDMLSKNRCKKGDSFGGSKLTEALAVEIRNRYFSGEKLKELGLLFKVDYVTIWCVVRGVTWQQTGGPILNKKTDMRKLRSGGVYHPRKKK